MVRVRAVNPSPRPDLRLGLRLGARTAAARVGLTTDLCLRRFVPRFRYYAVTFLLTRVIADVMQTVEFPMTHSDFFLTTQLLFAKIIKPLKLERSRFKVTLSK